MPGLFAELNYYKWKFDENVTFHRYFISAHAEPYVLTQVRTFCYRHLTSMRIPFERYAFLLISFWRQLSPAAAFLVIASVVGLAFCVITPPFQVSDEVVHYYRAYQISEGHLVARPVTGGYGDLLPANMEKQVGALAGDISFHPATKYDPRRTWENLRQPLDLKKRAEVSFEASAATFPLAYLPQAAGVGVGRLLGAPVIVQLFLGRLANLAVWIALVFWAIRLIPFGKWALFALALTPMSLFQAASVSPDAILNGTAFIFIAVCLRLMFEARPIARWEYAYIAAATAIFALTKVVYLPLVGLIALIPAERFGSARKRWLVTRSVILAGLLLAGLWNHYMRPIQGVALSKASAELGFEAKPWEQLEYIGRHPVAYAWAIANTYTTTRGDGLEQQFIGVLGWMDTKIPLWIVTLDILLIAYCLASIHVPRGPTIRERAVIALAGFVSFVGVTTALYVYYTPVGYPWVVGLQGRYLIPLSPLLIPLAANLNTGVRPSERSMRVTAVVVSVVVLTLSVCVLSYRYYRL